MARFRSPFQLVFPGIQQLPLQLQLTRQRLNVFTDLRSFHNLPLELHAVSTPLCHSGPSCHIASIRCKSASFPRVSLSGFSTCGVFGFLALDWEKIGTKLYGYVLAKRYTSLQIEPLLITTNY